MRLLLDTHILLALIENRVAGFGSHVQSLLKNEDAEFVVSVAKFLGRSPSSGDWANLNSR